MIGSTILHYKIIDKLGEGGMGVVYLAEDTRLERQVAIKFLPPHIAGNSDERKRFEIEAKAAAALNHPNIATVFAIEEAENELFLVMEYIEGIELKELVRAQNYLPQTDAINYAIQLAEGLQAAHKKGIVHRDIKSSNIMVTNDGKVKIMDFGLAKLRGSIQLTQIGTTLGTVAYMSPEQTKGDVVDNRADIWSFGVVLYEMLTGEFPFKGDYEQAVIYSILNESQEPLTTHSAEISEELALVLDKCLQKERSDRYQNASELITALSGNIDKKEMWEKSDSSNAIPSLSKKSRGFSSVISIIGTISIIIIGYIIFNFFGKEHPFDKNMLVVLPFENLGPNEEDYFAEGMTEEITSRLASIKTLGVISRKSALLYRNTDKTIEQIGEELGVNYILEGTVRWARSADGEERVRITPQLIQVEQDIHVWTDIYERTIKDIFQVQSEIAHKVVTELGITLLESEHQKLIKVPTENIEAYHLFLRGKYYLGQPHFTQENWNKAIDSFQRAAELDPNFALAYSELSKAHWRLYFVRFDFTPERLEKAKNAAEKALQLAKDSPEVHLNIGYYYLWAQRDPVRALKEFDIAENGLPNNVDILRAKTRLYETQGMWQEKIAIDERAAELSPRDASVLTDLAFAYWFTRSYKNALKTSKRAVALAPETIWPYLYVAHINWSMNGPNNESRAAIKHVPSTHSFWLWSVYWQEVGERNFEKAFELLENSESNWMKNKLYVRPKPLLKAFLYDYLNKKEEAHAAYDSARVILENAMKTNISDPRYHSSLGLSYAGLGKFKDAINEGKKAVELLPITKDAVYGTMFVIDLAAIYTMTGEYDLALEQIELLLSIPSPISKAWLKMDVRFKPLYNNPKFQNLPEKNPGENE